MVVSFLESSWTQSRLMVKLTSLSFGLLLRNEKKPASWEIFLAICFSSIFIVDCGLPPTILISLVFYCVISYKG